MTLYTRGSHTWIGAVAAVLLFTPAATARVAVTTQHNDNYRTGANLLETTLNTSNVNTQQFGLLFTRPVDDEIYTQPLYLPDVPLPGGKTRNLIFIGTVNNSLYAFDADDPAETKPVWHVNFGPAVPTTDVGTGGGSWCETYHDFSHLVGITGTPVVDPDSRTLYVVAKSKENGEFFQRLHAIDVASGQEKSGSPVVIRALVRGAGSGAENGVVNFNSRTANQRPALLLLNGVVYVGFGAHCDAGPFHGWLLGYNASTLQQVFVFNATPDGADGGIWQSGQGPSADAMGDIYISTGNGDVDPAAASFSMSVLRLRPQASASPMVVDWFTPYNWRKLNSIDRDLGSTGPLLLPGTNRVLACGKSGVLYLLDRDRMGHGERASPDDASAVEEIQAVQSYPGAPNAHLKGSPIYWNDPVGGPTIYLWGQQDHLRAYRVENNLVRVPAVGLSPTVASLGAPGAMLSLSANAREKGSGIVWACMPYNGDANQAVVPGILRAYDASDVTRELWNSRLRPERDSFGEFAKFSYPTVADGKVYVATFSHQLCVYGLFPPRMPRPPVGLAATTSENRTMLSWRVVPGAATYTVKRGITPRGPFLPLHAGAPEDSYVDTGMVAGTYFYTVSASNRYGESDDSAPVRVTVEGIPAAVAPVIPPGPARRQ